MRRANETHLAPTRGRILTRVPLIPSPASIMSPLTLFRPQEAASESLSPEAALGLAVAAAAAAAGAGWYYASTHGAV
jgi:hypothetical protein